MIALSIRQPWCWFILCGKPWAKDIENRDWWPPREMIGKWFQIHAAKTMTKADFESACAFAAEAGASQFPKFDELERGGIVGVVKLVKVVRLSTNKWFTGKFGLCLEDAYPVPFRPCAGQTGFFHPLAI